MKFEYVEFFVKYDKNCVKIIISEFVNIGSFFIKKMLLLLGFILVYLVVLVGSKDVFKFLNFVGVNMSV